MVEGVSRSELASLEQIIGAWMSRGWIPDACIQTLHFLITSKQASNPPAVRRAALLLIVLMSQHDSDILRGRLESLLQIPLVDPVAIEWSCRGLETLIKDNGKLPKEHPLLIWLEDRFLINVCNPAWLQCAAQLVRTIYKLADAPDVIVGRLVRRLCEQVQTEGNSMALVKLVQLAGEVAQQQSQRLDLMLNTSSNNKPVSEMEQIGGTAEDELAERIRVVRDSEMLGNPAGLLTHLAPLVGHVCHHNLLHHQPVLQSVATVSLARLMSISAPFCHHHLPLLLAQLEHSTIPSVRANLCIALGDLIRSHGSLLEPAYPCLFARLSPQENPHVRRQALMVITHLSLTGMIKVKGRLGEIAQCLLESGDADGTALSGLARVFFTEMASKDPAAIYNHLPDVISCLGQTEIEEADYELIMRFILSLIKKDRQMEGLVAKLCARFPLTDEPRHWRQLSLCLSLLPMLTDRPVRKLIESLPLLHSALQDRTVWRHLTDLIGKARRNHGEMPRSIIDELEHALVAAHDGKAAGSQNNTLSSITQDMRRMSLDAMPSIRKTRKPTAAKTKRSGVKWEVEDEDDSDERGKLRRSQLASDDDDDDRDGDDDDAVVKPAPRRGTRRSLRND